jgi:hypothetical protein
MRTGRSKKADGDNDEAKKTKKKGVKRIMQAMTLMALALALGVGVALEQRTSSVTWARRGEEQKG